MKIPTISIAYYFIVVTCLMTTAVVNTQAEVVNGADLFLEKCLSCHDNSSSKQRLVTPLRYSAEKWERFF